MSETTNTTGEQKPAEKKMTMFLIAWIIGWTGLHRYKMGYKNWWVQLLLSLLCGIGAIWALIDAIMILTGSLKMADGRELEK